MKNALLLLNILAAFCAQAGAQVVISEIHYNPVEIPAFNAAGDPIFQNTTTVADFTDDVHEFLELHNPTPSQVDLSGWRLDQGVEFTFPAGTNIAPGGFIVVAKNPARIEAVYGITGVLGPFSNGTKLKNSGDTVRLVTPSNVLSDSVRYETKFPWAISANKLGASDDFTLLNSANYQYRGRSLQRVSATSSSNDPANWVAVRPAIGSATFADLPTPGATNIVSLPSPKPVVIALSAVQQTNGDTVIRRNVAVNILATFSSTTSLTNPTVEYFVENINSFSEVPISVPMSSNGGNQYSAPLPAQSADRRIVRYRIVVDRGDGPEVVSPRADDPAIVPTGLNQRDRWHAYFISPSAGRSPVKPSYDCFVSTDGQPTDDTLGGNLYPFTGLNALQAMAYNSTGNMRRIYNPSSDTSSETTAAYPREPGWTGFNNRIQNGRAWNGFVPAIFVADGVVRDIQIRYHGSRYSRRPSRKSFKLRFSDHQLHQDADSVFITDKNDYFTTAHGLHQLAGLPLSNVRYVDWYFNNDAMLPRLEQGEYNGDLLEIYHDAMQRLNPGAPKEEVGELYKAYGIITGSNTGGEGPYGGSNGWRLPTVGGNPSWTELKRFEYTYSLQNHAWKGAKPIRDMINGLWTARGDTHTAPNLTAVRLANLKNWFTANWDVDSELTSLALGNWMCPWDDTTQNHYYWRRANGRWVRLLWDFDGMYGKGDKTSPTSSIYLGEQGLPDAQDFNNSRGPNWIKDSFIKAFRTEYKQRLWFLNNTLLDPENLQTLTYRNSSGSIVTYRSFIDSSNAFSTNRFVSVNSQVGLGPFYKPTRPTHLSPSNGSAILPGASFSASSYNYNAAFTHAAPPTVSPHTQSKWEIRTSAGSYNDPVYVLTSTTNLTSLPVPFELLTFGQSYFWRVTYFDADGHPSITSQETAFSYGAASATAGNVTINEIMAENRAAVANGVDFPDYVELKNNTAEVIDVSGWNLTDDELRPTRYTFPTGTEIPAGGYLVVWCDSNISAPGLHTGFGLSRKGQRVLLIQGTTVRDAISFGPQMVDGAIGRFADGTGAWRLVNATPGQGNTARTFSTATSTLKINEWMAVPASGDDWFEIYNSGTEPVSLTGLWLSDSPSTPKASQIPALSFVAAGGCVRFDADDLTTGFSSVKFKFSASGDNIVLTAADGTTTISSVTFGVQQPGVAQGNFPDGTGNIASFLYSASPGENNWLPASVRINEVLSNSVAPLEDYVEIHNPTAETVDISGWWLSDDPSVRFKYQLPTNSSIPAGGYLVLLESQFNTGASAFSLSSLGDEIVLTATDTGGTTTGFRSQFSFGTAADDVAFGYVSTAGAPQLWPLVTRTPGAANGPSQIGPVIISEVHYHPSDVGGTENLRDEFIELLNISTQPVDLSGWKILGGTGYTFNAGTVLSPGGHLIVGSFNPSSDSASSDGFRTAFNVGEAVAIHGPFAPKLPNDTSSIELARPVETANAGTLFVNVDKVEYCDFTPWPVGADGSGSSLQRVSLTGIGNDAANWTALQPAPGTSSLNGPPVAVADNLHIPFSSEPLTLPVRENDLDPNGDSLTISSVGPASNGNVSTDGSVVTYTPGPGFTGSDSFTYSIQDSSGATSTATVNLINNVPVAQSDSLHVPLASVLVLQVLANDSDADTDPRTIVTVGPATHGTVSTDGTTISYTPGPGFSGADTFTYTISDGHGGAASATVSLVNNPPVAVSDNLNVSATGASLIVTGNDSDPDLDMLTIGATSNGAGGTVTSDGNSITYTPGAGFTGEDQFTYTITDGHGGSSSATVLVRSTILVTATTASTGEAVMGLPDGQSGTLQTLQVPAVGEDGQLAWLATVKMQKARISAIVTGTPPHAIAAQGGSLDGIVGFNTGLKFTKFSHPVVDGAGRVAFIGAYKRPGTPKAGESAIFAITPGQTPLAIARSGGETDGIQGGKFSKFLALDARDGEIAFVAQVNDGSRSKVPVTGVWVSDGASTRLVVRNGIPIQTTEGEKTPSKLSLLSAVAGSPGHGRNHRSGEVAVLATFTDKSTGVVLFTFDGTKWTPTSLALSGRPAGIGGANFRAFGVPSIGKEGTVASLVNLTGGDATKSNDSAIVMLSGASEPLSIARESETNAALGAKYVAFSAPAAATDGQLAFTAQLSGSGVTKANNSALFWRDSVGVLSTIARTGLPATGGDGATWKRFLSFALPSGDQSGPVFIAELGGSGVSRKNNIGIWARDSAGELTLIARTGFPLATVGGSKSISKLALLNALPPVQGSTRSFNDDGKIAFVATFIDGTQAIVTARVP